MLLPTFCLSHFYISTCRSMCAVPNMAVFCSSVISYFPGCCSGIFSMILKWFQLPLLLLVSFLIFTFHMCCRSIKRSSYEYFQTLSASLLITFLSPEIPTSINIHLPFSLSRIMMSVVLLGMVLSVCPC